MNFHGSLATLEREGSGIFAERLDVLQEQLKERGEDDIAQVIAEAQRRLGDLQSEVDHLEFMINGYVAAHVDPAPAAAAGSLPSTAAGGAASGELKADHQWMERYGSAVWFGRIRTRIPVWQQCSRPGCGVSRAAAEHFGWVSCGGSRR